MPNLPSTLTYATITGTVLAAQLDGADAGTAPDAAVLPMTHVTIEYAHTGTARTATPRDTLSPRILPWEWCGGGRTHAGRC